MDEKSYISGKRTMAVRILNLCCQELGYQDIIADSVKWIIEREAAIVQLRMLCGDFGDNDWNENLNLADIVDKHLGRHLKNK